jgi:hypothetical protein
LARRFRINQNLSLVRAALGRVAAMNATKKTWVAAALFGTLSGVLGVTAVRAGTGDARSAHFRVISGSAASVTATATSPAYRAHLVGGSGAAVGIAASDHTSIVAGNSTIDPPVRLFLGTFEVP